MTAGMIHVPTIVPLRPPTSSTRKGLIDTRTPIELRTDTPGSIIYYTLDGTKPDPFQKLGERSTYCYRRPFVLVAGKTAVKALATSSDGKRESSVVTKVFHVTEAEPSEAENTEESDIEGGPGRPLSSQKKPKSSSLISQILDTAEGRVRAQEAWNEEAQRKFNTQMSGVTISGSDQRRPKTEPRFMNTRMGPRKYGHEYEEEEKAQVSPKMVPPDNRTQLSRIQQETDFLKCVYCFALRPSDPYARFCAECGAPVPPLPKTRLPPPEPGQLGMCVNCHAMIPLNTPACIICEAPLAPQRIPQATKRLADKIVCNICGTSNPPDLKTCVTCESKLPFHAKQIFSGSSAPPEPKSHEGRFVSCSKCCRVNSSDARFCDWCGLKPQPYKTHIVCSLCKASNQPYSHYCTTCGGGIAPPPRTQTNEVKGIVGTVVEKQRVEEVLGTSSAATWVPVSIPSLNDLKECRSQATQTGGLYFPSSKSIQSQFDAELEEKVRMEASRDRKPLLAAVSPGKGYWRQQMEHITSHLKAHAQNNPDFRASIGEPRMGKIIAATVHEDFDGQEVTLTVTLARRDSEKTSFKSKSKSLASGLNYLNTLSDLSKKELRGSTSSLASSTVSTTRVGKKKTVTAKKKKKPAKENVKALSAGSKALLREVGLKGQARVEEVERLLDEGADPNCENSEGVAVLTVATVNKHHECLPILIDQGAELSKKSLVKGNTALHEAVLAGSDAVQCVTTLLGCGADTNIQNDAGQSPYDLAVKSGNETIISKFTASLGQGLLSKFTKPAKIK